MIPAGALAQIGILEAVPVLQVTWADERFCCRLAHRYLGGESQGTPPEYEGCHFYGHRRCSMNGKAADPCLFHEDEKGASWEGVRRWRLLEYPDGALVFTTARDADEIAASEGARVVG